MFAPALEEFALHFIADVARGEEAVFERQQLVPRLKRNSVDSLSQLEQLELDVVVQRQYLEVVCTRTVAVHAAQHEALRARPQTRYQNNTGLPEHNKLFTILGKP